ncbi:MAG: 6,7-dimethyl-8-ribityllumazine synthase [Elusimicrobia bacterium]|nr:6,7-dimethyl-8-ribityllumazine synthase [Elusimicrobiota bacterium]
MAVKELSGNLIAKGLKIGVVASRFNDFLSKALVNGAVDCFVRHGGTQEAVTVAWVPGANELPMAVEKLAKIGKLDAIIALGVVIQGATPHAELINSQVSRSLAKVASDAGVPVINGVVAAENLEQAIERSGTKAGNKGWAAAQAAIEMSNLYKEMGR